MSLGNLQMLWMNILPAWSKWLC